MTSTLNKSGTAPEITFPCLMQSTANRGALVLMFISSREATVVHPDEDNVYELGYHSDDFVKADNEAEWKPFTGKIILSND